MTRNEVTPDRHNKRLRAERRFRWYGRCALGLAMAMLVLLIGSIVLRGYQGFVQTEILLPVRFDPALLGMEAGMKPGDVPSSSYNRLVHQALKTFFYPDAQGRKTQHELYGLVSTSAGHQLKLVAQKEPALMEHTAQIWVRASSNSDLFFKGRISETTPEIDRLLSDQQIRWLGTLRLKGAVRTVFNAGFFTDGNSRTPEKAGFAGAMIGSALTLIVCLLIAFPLGVMTAVYLEEFARPGHWVDVIEVNINNLAAVPSIVFGLLGLAVYINVLGLPRSAPLVGGMTLALMILPVIIITTRATLKSIPGGIRDAARALGASPVQVVWHHVLPLAMPGIMTGTILGLARAIGETAPLLMIGMVAFVADLPEGFTSAATVMPVQIYLWATSPETGFSEKTAAGILVLLVLLLAMNSLAIILRRRFEIRW